MKLTIKTTTLQNLVAKAVKGASNNKMIPLTSLMCIELTNKGDLVLTTTDASNYLQVKESKISGDEFYVVVEVETFAKLVAKTTKENIVLELDNEDNKLLFTGNGKYELELPIDEEGRLVKYPIPMSFDENAFTDTVKLSTIKTILSTAKSALSTSLDNPCYTGYYIGENLIATDTFKICGMGIRVLQSDALISAEMMDLLDVMDEEDIRVYRERNKIAFETGNCKITGNMLEGIEEYAVEPITGLLSTEFDSQCSVSKDELLQTLDRLSLFVGPYDKNVINLTFTNKGILISNKKSNGSELVEYRTSENFKDFTCQINIEMLVSQVKSHTTDSVDISYGLDNCIKITEGNVTQVIALVEE